MIPKTTPMAMALGVSSGIEREAGAYGGNSASVGPGSAIARLYSRKPRRQIVAAMTWCAAPRSGVFGIVHPMRSLLLMGAVVLMLLAGRPAQAQPVYDELP